MTTEDTSEESETGSSIDRERIEELIDKELRQPMTVVQTADNIGALVYDRVQTEHPNAVPPEKDRVRLDRRELSEFVALGRRQVRHEIIQEGEIKDVTELEGDLEYGFECNRAVDPVVTANEFAEITEREGHHRQLYRFEEAGLIEQFVLDAPKPGAMPETGYRLTRKGREELDKLSGRVPPARPEHELAQHRDDLDMEIERAIHLSLAAQYRTVRAEAEAAETRATVATMLDLLTGLDRETVLAVLRVLEDIQKAATAMDASPAEVVVAMATFAEEMDAEALATRLQRLDIDPPATPDPNEWDAGTDYGWDPETQ